MVMGDLTIDSKRLELIDFSIPIQIVDFIIMKSFFFLQKIEVFMIREYREICDLNNIVCT